MKNLLILSVFVNLACLFVSCVSPLASKPWTVDDSEAPERVMVNLGEWNFAMPLPIGRLTGLDSRQTSDSALVRTTIRSWDFDRDSQADMIEVLSSDGSVLLRLYDFDGDGKVDRIDDPIID